MPQSTDLLPGTLDLLNLKTLAPEAMHGWAKFYCFTTAGGKQLAREVATWDRLSSAIASAPGGEAEAFS
jgi:hypothetical protein